MNSGLSNLWESGKEGPYLVRHGQQPVRDFGRLKKSNGEESTDVLNLFERAFPCLFPYGTGGIEAPQPVEVDFTKHVRWALQYCDKRFRKHETFPFIVFGILQRRQALRSARLQTRRKTFDRDARILSSVTKERLAKAQEEEERGEPISDPAVRLLRQHVHTGTGGVMGSDQSRYKLRSQIWSTTVRKGPPSLWITINPSDLNDPITQIFAGENIDMEAFLATAGPDKKRRARNVAQDPYAAAKFFHFMIKTILETLFQVKVTKFQVKSGKGLLGRVAAYFGTVESQGRGTLHLHLLIWLEYTPSSDELLQLLKTEEFRTRVVAFIKANIRSYVPGLESNESIKMVPKDSEIAYNRPPNPDDVDYDTNLKEFELRVARSEQVHTCKPRRCLIQDRDGQLRCKRRAPFNCSPNDFIMENGEWGSKRLHPYINAWNPGILVNARCNNDIKLLTNGADTRNISFYVTSYAAKKQGKIHNLSAILSKAYAYHEKYPKPSTDSLQKAQGDLINRLVNAINREQELASVMVMSLLMGWGDVYRSHHYAPIYWSSFSSHLCQAFPELRKPTK